VPLSPRKDLERQQRRWADSAGIDYDARGFVRDPDANLRVPLAASTRAAFLYGTELTPRKNQPARISALHSSAALVANVFDHWSARDAAPLGAALGLGLDGERIRLAFEEPLATGVEGDPPLSDIVLRCESGRIVAIESKFGEWLARRSSNRLDLKPKYFAGGSAIWEEAGLPRCQRLAEDLRLGRERFKHLHAAQLLKHALGLARETRAGVSIVDRADNSVSEAGAGSMRALRYLYYEWPHGPAVAHRAELECFADRVGGEIRFSASTYQDLYRALEADARVDRAYLDYLRARYFRVV
jgi:restriction endonuclease-like protein